MRGFEGILTRASKSHKGHYGHLLLIAGSRTMPGALQLSAQAALRTGVGKLTILTVDCVKQLLMPHIPEAMWLTGASNRSGSFSKLDSGYLMARLNSFSAIAVGPGLGKCSRSAVIALEQILKSFCGPVVLDADGLQFFKSASNRVKNDSLILTPHEGEFSKIFKLKPPVDLIRRRRCVRNMASDNNCILLLKGNPTLICDSSGKLYQNRTGNPGMATAGSGDVLTGVIGSLLAQRIDPFLAAKLAAYIHGTAGDKLAKRYSQASLIASDLISEFPKILEKLES